MIFITAKCEKCGLRGNPHVPPSGKSKRPLIAFVGEAPGYTEVRQGAPFVGMSGKLIRTAAKYLSISPGECYFTNVCSCRPPHNRTPTASEIQGCSPRLFKELESVRPQYIVALGSTAGKVLFKDYTNLTETRGEIRETAAGTKGILTYHPAAILYGGGDLLLPYLLNDLRKIRGDIEGITSIYYDRNTQVVSIRTDEEMREVVEKIKKSPKIAFDWETRGTELHEDMAVCLGISWKVGTAVAIPADLVYRHKEELCKAFASTKTIAYNIMFDSKVNEMVGLPKRTDHDSMLLHYAIDERPQRRSLENIAVELCNADRYETRLLREYNTTKERFIDEVPSHVIEEYCGKDADYALRIFEIAWKEISKFPSLTYAYMDVIMKAARAFTDIQHHGIWVNKEKLEKVTEEHKARLEETLSKIRSLVGNPEFNPKSPKQVHKLLWDDLRLEQPKIRKKKDRCADSDVRQALLETYDLEIIKELEEYNHLYTMASRYLYKLPDRIRDNGRVYPRFHLDRTKTGRTSATEPPIQQIPTESNIRSIFGAPPGRVLIQSDYKQVEIRMAAHYAEDKKLIELLNSGADFHTLMASEAFGVSESKVSEEERSAAKAVSFGLLYLMGDKSLADYTGLPKSEALNFVKRYKSLMPDVFKWIENIKRKMREDKYVESLFGRRRRFPIITKSNVEQLQREAVNMPIQSAASDLTLCSMADIHDTLRITHPTAFVNNMVHDSLIVEADEGEAEQIAKMKEKFMTKPPFETKVPFPVEIKIGKNWGEGEVFKS